MIKKITFLALFSQINLTKNNYKFMQDTKRN